MEDRAISERVRRLAAVPLAAAMIAAAGLAFDRVFALSSILPVIAVATVTPAALSLALSTGRRPWSLWTSLLVTTAGWLIVVSVTLFRADSTHGLLPSAATVSEAVGGLRDGPRALLSEILPAPDQPRLLVFVHALTWFATFAAVELALRARAALLPAVPACAMLVVALLLGVDGPPAAVPAVPALLVALAVLLALLRGADGVVRGALGAGPALAAGLGLIAVGIGPVLPMVSSRPPFDPRALVPAPPADPHDAANPLDEISAWLIDPNRPLFTVRAPVAKNWRLAVLDRFDGITWSPSARFVPTGSRVPAGPQAAGTRNEVRQVVTIEDLPGAWLPAADRPTLVTGVRAQVDPASGTLLSADPLYPGLQYEVTSAVTTYRLDDLQDARPAADVEAAAALTLPGDGSGQPLQSLESLREHAQQATAGSTTPSQQAVALEHYLSTTKTNDWSAPPGNGLQRLDFFLQKSSNTGTSEQFAAAFAVMARTLGLPSRVAVGFQPGSEVAADTWQVRAGDVLAWPEVDFRGLGWVPFYPTPAQTRAPAGAEAVPAGAPPSRQAIDHHIAAAPPVGAATPRPVRRQAEAATAGLALPLRAIATAIGGTATALYVVVVVAARRLRRWRRRRRLTPAGLVGGAWREAVDQLRDVGVAATPSMTASEVAVRGAAAVGTPAAAAHLLALASLANRAGFAAETPSAADAEDAWRHCDILRQLVVARVGRLGVFRRRLAPRSLLT
jgi:hypothetical protein